MLFSAAVVLAFFLCWLPFHTQRIAYIYFNESKFYRKVNEYLFYISGVLYYFSATVNPILYNLMSLKYRHAFYQTLFGRNGCCCCKGKDSSNRHQRRDSMWNWWTGGHGYMSGSQNEGSGRSTKRTYRFRGMLKFLMAKIRSAFIIFNNGLKSLVLWSYYLQEKAYPQIPNPEIFLRPDWIAQRHRCCVVDIVAVKARIKVPIFSDAITHQAQCMHPNLIMILAVIQY